MLRHVLFDMALFASEADRANSQKRVLWLLEALTCCNRLYLQQHPETPLIYKSGIQYVAPAQFEGAEVPQIEKLREFLQKNNAPSSVMSALEWCYNIVGGGEIFREIPRIIENGGGDCDNVAAWRAAELRQLGIAASPFIVWRRRSDGGMTYHVVVKWPDSSGDPDAPGTIEDPSLLLGMGGEARAKDREEEVRKMAERASDFAAALMATGSVSTAIRGIGSGLSDRIAGSRTRVDGLTVTTPQDFSSLQYTHPFQTDDAMYEDWSPTRPQGFYTNIMYPNLPSTPGGVPMFNTLMRDADSFDGEMLSGRQRQRARRAVRQSA